MGWRFSRSINLGPLRINLSKRGLGASLGSGCFRVGRSAHGRTYGSARIPGTGLSYRKESKQSGRIFSLGCLALLLIVPVAAVLIGLVVLVLWR